MYVVYMFSWSAEMHLNFLGVFIIFNTNLDMITNIPKVIGYAYTPCMFWFPMQHKQSIFLAPFQ